MREETDVASSTAVVPPARSAATSSQPVHEEIDATMPRPALRHWFDHAPEYLIEAWGLGTFVLSAGFFGTLLEYPGSPVHQAVVSPLARRALMGIAMGLTSIALIDSPWGRRSGAHLNPATTLMFARLGKVRPRDAIFYVLAQFSGGALGVALVLLGMGAAFRDSPVRCVATLPGEAGQGVAFLAEVGITFLFMTVVLHVSNHARWHRFTGLCAGLLVAIYIAVEAPISGMSMNPARTLASALWAGSSEALWIYFIAPPPGMLLAAQAFLWLRGAERLYCAKLNHRTRQRCIFACRFGTLQAR